MYHPGYREMTAVSGFTVSPELSVGAERAAMPKAPLFSERPQDWVVVEEWGNGGRTLIDTSDIWRNGPYRLAWLKYQLNAPAKVGGADREVKEMMNLEEYDCEMSQFRIRSIIPVFADSTPGRVESVGSAWEPLKGPRERPFAYLCRAR
jgi:hypothetical protein